MTYGDAHPASAGARVTAVDEESPAQRAGLRADDVVTCVAGSPMTDVLVWLWEADGATVEVEYVRDGVSGVAVLSREPGECWGMAFDGVVFDGVRRCRNNCAFCFMSQLPPDMRPSLYLRDDDYRLSFLQGNFITLTNLEDADVSRIVEQHISPLHISIHSVSTEVRARLVRCAEDRALERFDQLVEGGIDAHVQIVLVPGVNDGEQLDATLTWLAQREGVVSVGIVAVGRTDYSRDSDCTFSTAESCAEVIEQVAPWQVAFRERDGVSWVYLADEFYLAAGVDVPKAEYYDGFPQYENGIGLVRAFLDEITAHPHFEGVATAVSPIAIITGTLAAPVLGSALAKAGYTGRFRLLAVQNRFFGGNVTVAGLLTASDIADAITVDREMNCDNAAYLVPDVIFNSDGLTLDGLTVSELEVKAGVTLRVVSSDAAALLAGIEQMTGTLPDNH